MLFQNKEVLQAYFCKDAVIRWHCTNEIFSVQEYIKDNCDYPGEWDGEIERIYKAGETWITVVCVFPRDKSASFHAVSFIKLKEDRISEIDEYWGAAGEAPEWRLNMRVGAAIR